MMASVFRRRTSKNWSCAFRDEHGRQHLISTKTDDKKLALVLCQEFEKAARVKRTKQQTQRTIDRLHEMISGERISRYSLRDYAASWLKAKKHETRSSTMEFYRKSVEKTLSFLKADLPLTEFSRDDVLSYRAHLADTVSPKTANHHLKTLKMIFKAARRDGILADDPSEFVSGIKQIAQATRRAFSASEIEKVLPLCDAEWRSMVLFALYTGQRLADNRHA